jgi:predicted AlkP superfamily pyrophosphatase or phosphodiesterase
MRSLSAGFRLTLLSLLVLLPGLGCGSARPGPQAASPGAESTASVRRVVLLSLDGASSAELARLRAAGALTAGGFERFFREGQVAAALVPVNPTLTAVNHISLATGFDAAATGIVSNTFRLPGSEWLSTTSGFAAPIGTETLWEAVRRQGRRVGSTTWPGADGRGERRQADWGLLYVNDPLRRAEVVTLSRSDWRVPETVPGEAGDASRGQVLTARVDLAGREGQVGAQTFDLFAVDRKDDAQVGYDSVVVAERPRPPGQGISGPVAVGAWGEVPVQLPGAGRVSRVRIKVLALAPDLSSARVYVGPLFALDAYPEAYAAEVAASGLVWPGPPDDRRLADGLAGKPGIDIATWTEQAETFTAFFGETLRVAVARPDWDLLLGYVPVIDEAGHQLWLEDPRQPYFTPELQRAAAAARTRVWQAVDRELAGLLARLDLRTTTVAVVSDHGMAPVHTALDPNVLLSESGLLATGEGGRPRPEGTRVHAVSSGAVCHVYLAPDLVDPAERQRLSGELRTLFAAWEAGGERTVARIFTRREAATIGLDHPNSGDLVLFAAPGFTFHGGGLAQNRAVLPSTALGMHGYVNDDPRMHGIYLTLGAGIKPGRPGPVKTTEIASRVAAWLGIEPPRRTP